MDKLNNGYTINIDDNLKNMIESLAQYYQRRPRELLRLLLKDVIIEEYAKMQLAINKSNSDNMHIAIFKK